MPVESVHNGGIPSLATIASGNARDRRSERGVAGFGGLVKELADDETAGISRPQLAESGLVGDAFACSEVRDGSCASEPLTQPLRREERRGRSPSIPTRKDMPRL